MTFDERGTGRTTRMVDEAIKAWAERGTVVVIMMNAQHADMLLRSLPDVLSGRGIEFVRDRRNVFVMDGSGNRLIVSPSCGMNLHGLQDLIVFEDHAIYEQRRSTHEALKHADYRDSFPKETYRVVR